MKITNKLNNTFLLVFAIILLVSCSEVDPIGSDITFYADVQLIGERTMIITQGDTFSDPGATSVINGEQVDFTTTGTVDANTPGVYRLNYETINEDGFPASADRAVVVLSSAPSIYDLSGNWARTNGSPGLCVKISDRAYTYDNAGGVKGPNQLKITFYNVDDDLIYIPFTIGASESGIRVESIDGRIVDNNNFNWSLSASGFYGTFTRRFVRQ